MVGDWRLVYEELPSRLQTSFATTSLSSLSKCNYVADLFNTTCNYVVIFLFNMQQIAISFLAFVNNLQLGRLPSFRIATYCNILQLRSCLLQHNLQLDCHCNCMFCIKRIRSQQSVFTKPWFTPLCGFLAMEVYKPQCHLTHQDHRSFEAHLLAEQVMVFQSPQKPSDENELLLWFRPKTPTWRNPFSGCFWWNCVSPQCHTHFNKVYFCEHGFRSARMFVTPEGSENGMAPMQQPWHLS